MLKIKLISSLASVSFENTGNELLALLKENQEIKELKPKYNRALKRDIFSHALYHFKDDNGYINLKIGKASRTKKSITTFSTLRSAKNSLQAWIEEEDHWKTVKRSPLP